jgi:hypothetical protein
VKRVAYAGLNLAAAALTLPALAVLAAACDVAARMEIWSGRAFDRLLAMARALLERSRL